MTVRAEDLLGRIGGEEFAVLLPGTSLAEATVVAEKLRGAVAQSACSCGAERLPMTISIGVAAMTAKIQTVDALMREADRQLYLSKRRGRNCVSATDC